MKKTTMTFSGLVLATGSFIAGVTLTGGDGETEVAVSADDLQRLGRNHSEAQRKKAQDAGDPLLQQSWLIERKQWEAIISTRVWRDAWLKDREAVSQPGTSYGVPSVMPPDAAVGEVSNIGYSIQKGHIIAYCSARMEAGQAAWIHAHDTSDWSEVVAGDMMQAAPPDAQLHPVLDYHLVLWIDIEPGKTYQIEAWVGGGEKKKITVIPEP